MGCNQSGYPKKHKYANIIMAIDFISNLCGHFIGPILCIWNNSLIKLINKKMFYLLGFSYTSIYHIIVWFMQKKTLILV